MTIKQQQLLLAYLGYDPGTIDGVTGPKTKAAIRAFQQDFGGLAVDGVAGTATQKALRHAVAYGMPEKNQTTDSKDSSATGSKTGTFWDDIEFFTREEFRCKCGGKYCNGFPAEMSENTVRCADEIRRRAGVPLRVNSGLRCDRWNTIQGGVKNSNHRTGHAADLSGNISPAKLYDIAQEVHAEKIPGRGGLGLYGWGIHEDDGVYSRWNG